MNVQTKMKTAKPNVVNGINVDDLFALIDGVKRDAANGKTTWRVTTAWQGQARSHTQVDGFGTVYGIRVLIVQEGAGGLPVANVRREAEG